MAYTDESLEQRRAKLLGKNYKPIGTSSVSSSSAFIDNSFEQRRKAMLQQGPKLLITPKQKNINNQVKQTSGNKLTATPSQVKPVTSTQTIKNSNNFADGFFSGLKRIKEQIGAGTQQAISNLQTSGGVALTKWEEYTKNKLDRTFRGVSTHPEYIKRRDELLMPLTNTSKKFKQAGLERNRKAEERIAELGEAPNKALGLVEDVARSAPVMLGGIGVGAATTLVTKNPLLGVALGFGNSFSQESGAAYIDAKKYGANEKVAENTAIKVGTVSGLIDMVPFGEVLKRLPQGKQIKKHLLREITGNIIHQGLSEGSTESIQQVVNNTFAREYDKNRHFFDGVPESFITGGILGVGTGLTVDVGAAVTSGKDVETTINEANKKIEDALDTPVNKRTPEQKEIVKTILTTDLNPREAMAVIAGNNLENTTEGKNMLKVVAQAQEQDKNIRITASEDQKTIDVEIVEKNALEQAMDESLFDSEQEVEILNKDTKFTRETREKVQEIESGMQIKKETKEINKEKLSQLNDEEIEAVKEINRYVESAIQKGNDYSDIFKQDVYKKNVDSLKQKLFLETDNDVINEIQNLSKQETVSREETKELKVLKTYLQPKTVEVKQDLLPEGEGKLKVSKLEARMKKSLDKLDPNTVERLGLTTYRELNKKENIAKAAEFVQNNKSDAMKVLTGEIEAPPGILRNSIFVAMQNMAVGDVNLARKLASLESTKLGQELSILTEIDQDSPVRVLDELYRVRKESFEKKFGKKKGEAVKKAKSEIKKQIKKPDKYDWNDFISSLEC